MLPPLWQALVALCAMSLLLGHKGIIVTAFVLMADWLAGYAIYLTAGSDYIWQAKAAIDISAAVLLLIGNVCYPQLAIAAIFVVELLIHVAFSIVGSDPASRYYYWWVLYDLAIAQAVILLLWGGYDASGGIRGRRDSDRHLWSVFASYRASGRKVAQS